MPMVNEKKRKNQTSLLQFSKKKEVKNKEDNTDARSKNALIAEAEKENLGKSVKPVSSFFSSVKTLCPTKEAPAQEDLETQPNEQEVE